MGVFSVVMLVLGMTIKLFTSILRTGAGLQQQGMLLPFLLVFGGVLYANTLDEPYSAIVYTLSIIIGIGVLTLIQKLKGEKNIIDEIISTKNANKTTKAMRSIKNRRANGVVFGRAGKKYMAKPENTDGHILVVGGVGSGKTSCIVIPTLRAWSESVFAIDIKGELYEQSKEYRQNINVFNPIIANSYGYNPFYCLRNSANPTQEARAIAQAIIPLPYEIKDPFWLESAQNLFTACILHFSGVGLSFLETIQQIQSTAIKSLIQEICQSGTCEARYFANNFECMEEKTLAGIMAEVSKNIVPFVTDKDLISALSKQKNITPEDLEYGNDIYIQIPEHLLRQWKTLLTLIVSQFLTHFERRNEQTALPILFLLDEFPRLGKIPSMLDGLATLRSKKVSICLIVQSLAQLDVIYGTNERKVICDTCSYKAILGATDTDTQEYFSRLVGTYEKKVIAYGTNSDVFGLGRGTSTTTHEVEKRIIKPEEFGQLTDIVLLTPYGMARVRKTPYYLR
ncbi:MAG: type IV secretory system conjugative DNA transfer family protein [Defluviitaleaceae bacterium]|nr:type IV secretory system conjugative DNA transfer family protein [Defluviitaleaceae bacterium]